MSGYRSAAKLEILTNNMYQRHWFSLRFALPIFSCGGCNHVRHQPLQTGTGKTYTMMGPPADRGVNARALGDLFTRSAARRGEVRHRRELTTGKKCSCPGPPRPGVHAKAERRRRSGHNLLLLVF